MPRTFARFANCLTIACIAVACAGCSLDEDTLQSALDKAQQATAGKKSIFTSAGVEDITFGASIAESLEGELAVQDSSPSKALATNSEPLSPQHQVPYPERSNPFEFGEGINLSTPHSQQNENLEIKLFGFVGAEHPKAIISLDGRTKALQAGEKWGMLEILEVTPPAVRIKSNGVIRVWSLLGHYQQTSS